jgi:hypothetical protein
VRDEWEDTLPFDGLDILSIEEAGERVLSHIVQSQHGRASGVPLTVSTWGVWSFRGDLIARFESYLDEQAARQAADA